MPVKRTRVDDVNDVRHGLRARLSVCAGEELVHKHQAVVKARVDDLEDRLKTTRKAFYDTLEEAEGTVSIDRHTGKTTVQSQLPPEIYHAEGNPFNTLGSFLAADARNPAAVDLEKAKSNLMLECLDAGVSKFKTPTQAHADARRDVKLALKNARTEAIAKQDAARTKHEQFLIHKHAYTPERAAEAALLYYPRIE